MTKEVKPRQLTIFESIFRSSQAHCSSECISKEENEKENKKRKGEGLFSGGGGGNDVLSKKKQCCCGEKAAVEKTTAPWWKERTKKLSEHFPPPPPPPSSSPLRLTVPGIATSSTLSQSQKLSWVKFKTTTSTSRSSPFRVVCTGDDGGGGGGGNNNNNNEPKKPRKNVAKRSKKVLGESEFQRCRKIRISPTPKQKQLFHKWFGFSRHAYNEALHFWKNEGHSSNWMALKMMILNNTGEIKKKKKKKKKDDDDISRKKKKKTQEEEEEEGSKPNPRAGLYPWFFEKDACPYALKVSAIHEFSASLGATKERGFSHFEMKPKSVHDTTQSFGIEVNGVNVSVVITNEGFKFWPTYGVGLVKPHRKRELGRLQAVLNDHSKNADTLCRSKVTLKYEYPNRYFLIVPIVVAAKKKKDCEDEETLKKEGEEENTLLPVVTRKGIAALDPGVRTFQTLYDSEGNFKEFGTDGDILRIMTLLKRSDKLQSRIDKLKKENYKSKKDRRHHKNLRRSFRRQATRFRTKATHLRRDCHWRIADHLCSNYDTVMIPNFRVSQMVARNPENTERKRAEQSQPPQNRTTTTTTTRRRRRRRRVINKTTTRQMLNWGHYEFRTRLQIKAEQTGCAVHLVSEHYTSKACGACGHLHHKLGSAKTFKCPTCGFTLDRDFNGARNIFLMNLENCLGGTLLFI